MNAEKINFSKYKEYESGEKFSFRFEGNNFNQNIDKEKVKKLIDSFVNEYGRHKDMLRNVSFLRTILKGFKEKLLVVEYSDINNQEIVKYDNGVLFLYNCKNKSEAKDNSLNAEFAPGKGLNISITDFDEDSIIDYPNSKEISEQFSKLIQHISLLKNAKAINLDMDSKILIEIYKLFYNENPNFSISNINVRIQTMMSILAQFGISLGDDYAFSLWGKVKMPISLNLEQLVNKLFPLGEITSIDEPIKIAEEPKRIIKIVGECVREIINDGYNKDEALITISKVIHAGRYSLSSTANVEELSKFTNRSQNEVESSIRLVKCIEKKLNKSNEWFSKIIVKTFKAQYNLYIKCKWDV